MIVYGKTDKETIELTAKSFGIPLAEAEHLLAIARGKATGKFVVIDKGASSREDRQRGGAAPRRAIAKLKVKSKKGKHGRPRDEAKPPEKAFKLELV